MCITSKLRAKFAAVIGIAGLMGGMAGTVCAADEVQPADYYTEKPMFQSRPDPTRERYFGVIGTTGLKPRIYPGAQLSGLIFGDGEMAHI